MKKMRLFLVLISISLWVSGATVYADHFVGPLEPDKKSSIGLGSFQYASKWTPKDSNQDKKSKTWTPNGLDQEKDIELKGKQIFLQGSWFLGGIEMYARIGYLGLEMKDVFATNSPELSGFKPDFQGKGAFWAFGIRRIFNFTSWLGMGPFLQVDYSMNGDSTKGTIRDTSGYKLNVIQEMAIRTQDANFGILIQGRIFGTIIYAGPVMFMTAASVVYQVRMADGDYVLTTTTTKYQNDKDYLGGVAGLRLPLVGGLSATVEGQKTNVGISVGGFITFSF